MAFCFCLKSEPSLQQVTILHDGNCFSAKCAFQQSVLFSKVRLSAIVLRVAFQQHIASAFQHDAFPSKMFCELLLHVCVRVCVQEQFLSGKLLFSKFQVAFQQFEVIFLVRF